MIGWYVHHHGFGHLSRFLAIRPHLLSPVTVFSSLPRPAGLADAVAWVELPPDADPVVGADGAIADPRDADPTVGGMLHWAPLGHPGHRARLATIARFVAEQSPAAFVVDVSAEVTAFVRLLGVPTVAVSQPGERTDAAHSLAYDLATRIVAPWAEGSIPSTALERRPDRAAWAGAVSRFDDRPRGVAQERRVLFLGRTVDAFDPAAEALRGAGWTVGAIGVDAASRVDDPWQRLTEATVVVSAAGQNSVADLAAAGARAVVVPQERPFGEQQATADALDRLGLALVAQTAVSASALLDLVERAALLDADWTPWQVAGGARRAAALIEEVAA